MILEAKKYAIAKNSLGVFGLITSSSKKEVRYSDGQSEITWTGIVIEDVLVDGLGDNLGKIIQVDEASTWSSKFPDIYYYVDENTLFSGYEDDLNMANIKKILENIKTLDSYKKMFFEKYSDTIPKSYINIEDAILKSYDDFEAYFLPLLGERFGTHSTHCCEQHGCKYGHTNCPVESGLIKAQYDCEVCYDLQEEAKSIKKELSDMDDNALIKYLNQNPKLIVILEEMTHRDISVNTLIRK